MTNSVGEELEDKVNGRVIDWNSKKRDNQKFAEVVAPIFEKMYDEERYMANLERVQNCAQTLKHYRDMDGNMRLYQAWFCKNRFCPMCTWRKSLKDGFILTQVLTEFMKQYPKSKLLFVTLTLNDTGIYDGKAIRNRIAELKKGTAKMFRDCRISRNVLGLVKSLEITAKPDEYSNTGARFHVHLHVLVGVKSTYFTRGNYLSKQEWIKLWRDSARVEYDPSVYVEAVKLEDVELGNEVNIEMGIKKKKKKKLFKAVAELTKYMTKSSDYLKKKKKKYNESVLEQLMIGLKGAQSISYTGKFRTIKAKLKADDDDLIHITGKESGKQTIQFVCSMYNGKRKKYYVYNVSGWRLVNFDTEKEYNKLVKQEVARQHENQLSNQKHVKIESAKSVLG